MPYYPGNSFVPLNGGVAMTGTLTTPGVIASSNGTAAAPAFAVNTNYGIHYDSGNTALGFDAAGTEVFRVSSTLGLVSGGGVTLINTNNTIIPGSTTTAALPTYVTGGLRYVTDIEGGPGVAYGGAGSTYHNVLNSQVATATVSGAGVLSNFTGYCNFTYRTILQNTHAQLVSTGLLAKLGAFYVFAVPTNQTDALINWATPNIRPAVITGTPVWTANQGFTGDGATALITAGPTFAQVGASLNNITVGCYVLVANTSGAAERPIIGQNTPGQGRRTYMTSFTSGTLHTVLSTQSATGDAWTPSRYTGLMTMSRNLSTGYNDSVDDVAATAITSTSTVLGSLPCWLGTNDLSGAAFSNAQLAVAFFGVGLTTTDAANLRAIIRDYYLVQIGALSAGYTVTLLPLVTTVPTGTRNYVTDANATTFATTVAGGGANVVPVFNNGTNWIIG
jgi:hypothetical protein